MASALIGLRYFVFGLFIICNTVLCSVAVWNLSLVESRTFYNAQVSAYVIFLGAFSLLCIFPIIFLDLIRRNAYTSRVWVELIWVTIFWIMELSGAAALSAIVPSNHCRRRRGRIANACLSGKVLLGFAWAITLILFAYLITLAVCIIVHHVTDPNVWNETVREYPWFAGRSTLASSPPSPTVEKGLGARPLEHPRPRTTFDPSGLTRESSQFDDTVQPVPTFDRIPEPSYRPAERSYEGLHIATMQDPPPIIDPVFTRPREAPKPPAKVLSLYPEHMQAQLSMETRNNLYSQSSLLEGQEPSPIGDWPNNSRKTGTSHGHGRGRSPPTLPRTSTGVSRSTQQSPSSISSDRRPGFSGATDVSLPVSPYKLGSPTRGPQRSNSIRKQPPPPLNLDGISNTSHHAHR